MADTSQPRTPRRGRRVETQQKKSMLPFYIVAGVLVIVGGALVFTFLAAQGNDPVTAVADEDGVVTESAFVADADFSFPAERGADGFYFKGDPDAPVTVVEYADYQCPACANFTNSTLYDQLTTDYITTGQALFIFRDFPLSQFPNSPTASQAAYCAGEQGYFWAMHGEIFRRQPEWSGMAPQGAANRFVEYAVAMGLDQGEFESCMNDSEIQQHIQQAVALGISEQVQATPTFLVNGRQVTALELTAAIDAAIAANE